MEFLTFFTSLSDMIPPRAIIFECNLHALFSVSIPSPFLPFESKTGENVMKSEILAFLISSNEWVEVIKI